MDDSELRNSLMALHSASFAWALVCCRDRELAEEVLQTAYVKVLAGRAPPDGRASLRTWLFAVIRNAARDQQRKRWFSGVLRLDFESLAQLATEEQTRVDDDDELSMVRAALAKLPSRQRQIAHLVFYEDLTVAQAAEVMGVAVGTARQHYARAKQTLGVLLQPLWNPTDESLAR